MFAYPKNHDEAAKILDAVNKEWYNEVWLYKFMQSDGEGDLLTQLYDSYNEGCAALFGAEATNEQKLDTIFGQNIDYMTWEILILRRVRAEKE